MAMKVRSASLQSMTSARLLSLCLSGVVGLLIMGIPVAEANTWTNVTSDPLLSEKLEGFRIDVEFSHAAISEVVVFLNEELGRAQLSEEFNIEAEYGDDPSGSFLPTVSVHETQIGLGDLIKKISMIPQVEVVFGDKKALLRIKSTPEDKEAIRTAKAKLEAFLVMLRGSDAVIVRFPETVAPAMQNREIRGPKNIELLVDAFRSHRFSYDPHTSELVADGAKFGTREVIRFEADSRGIADLVGGEYLILPDGLAVRSEKKGLATALLGIGDPVPTDRKEGTGASPDLGIKPSANGGTGQSPDPGTKPSSQENSSP